MGKRVRLTGAQYNELIESRDYCHRKGYAGMTAFYNELLAFQASRRALPGNAVEYQRDDEERDERRGDRR